MVEFNADFDHPKVSERAYRVRAHAVAPDESVRFLRFTTGRVKVRSILRCTEPSVPDNMSIWYALFEHSTFLEKTHVIDEHFQETQL